MEANKKMFLFSNLTKKSCWKRLLLPDNVVNLLLVVLIVSFCGYAGFFSGALADEAMIWTLIFDFGVVALCLCVILIVCSASDERPCLWDPNFINKKK